MFAIKSDNGGQPYFLCDGEGDPSRTLCLDYAKLFNTKSQAEKYKQKIVKQNTHRIHLQDNLKIVNIGMYVIE